MDRIKRIPSKNTSVILYVTFCICFTSLALWDVKVIIHDYIYDNRYTLVKAKNSFEDRYPFLTNPLICLHYDQPLIPGITWLEFFSMLNDSLHERDISWPRNASEQKKLFGAKIFTLVKYSLAEGAAENKDLAEILGVSVKEYTWLLDKFIENPESVTLIRNIQVDEEFSQKFIQKFGEEKISDLTLRLYGFETKTFLSIVCLHIPLVEDLSNSMEKVQDYYFDLNLIDYLEKGKDEQPNLKAVVVNFLDEPEQIIDLSANQSMRVDYEISNSQILDSSRFPPCAAKFGTEQDCLVNLQQLVIEQTCPCKKFDHKYFASNNSKIDRPFCKKQTYGQCWLESIDEVKQQKQLAIKKGTCKPCSSITNSVKKSTQIYENDPKSYILSFNCIKETYLLFEEKPQFNFSQLVSQIGGDLGLYIGFSMISIFQLILFLYHMHQQRRNPDQANEATNRNWFRFYTQYIAKSFKSTDEQNGFKLQDLERQLQELRRDVSSDLKEIKQQLVSQTNPSNSYGVFRNLKTQNFDEKNQETKF